MNTIKGTPGIGPKIAQRIVSELKDKAPNLMTASFGKDFEKSTSDERYFLKDSSIRSLNDVEHYETEFGESDDDILRQVHSMALSALTNLGYSSVDAATAIGDVLKDKEKVPEVQELIKLALKSLSLKV